MVIGDYSFQKPLTQVLSRPYDLQSILGQLLYQLHVTNMHYDVIREKVVASNLKYLFKLVHDAVDEMSERHASKASTSPILTKIVHYSQTKIQC